VERDKKIDNGLATFFFWSSVESPLVPADEVSSPVPVEVVAREGRKIPKLLLLRISDMVDAEVAPALW
jgi:hypothetical protein